MLLLFEKYPQYVRLPAATILSGGPFGHTFLDNFVRNAETGVKFFSASIYLHFEMYFGQHIIGGHIVRQSLD